MNVLRVSGIGSANSTSKTNFSNNAERKYLSKGATSDSVTFGNAEAALSIDNLGIITPAFVKRLKFFMENIETLRRNLETKFSKGELEDYVNERLPVKNGEAYKKRPNISEILHFRDGGLIKIKAPAPEKHLGFSSYTAELNDEGRLIKYREKLPGGMELYARINSEGKITSMKLGVIEQR